MVPGGGEVVINGNTLAGIFGGQISSINLIEIDGFIYKWQINVTGDANLFKDILRSASRTRQMIRITCRLSVLSQRIITWTTTVRRQTSRQ